MSSNQAWLALITFVAIFGKGLAITCYARFGTTTSDNGGTATCSSSGAICYSYVSYGGLQYAGCTTLTSYCSSSYKSCITCTTDYCNNLNSSSITCYSRIYSSTSSNGTLTTCPAGHSTCYTSSVDGESGCGSCGSSTSCSTCSTNFCNYQSTIQCYYRYGTTSSSRGVVSCSSGSCYSYSYFFGLYYYYYNGCGSCSSYSYGNCQSCTTNLCNSATVKGISMPMMLGTASVLLLSVSFKHL